MKLSAQEEYGLRCLVTLARSERSLTIPEISEIEGMTQPHAAKILAILRKEGFIQSTRGQTGGYTLAQKPEQIVIGRVMEALGGRLLENDYCDRFSGTETLCRHKGECALHGLWAKVQGAIDDVVRGITLADLLAENSPKFDVRVPLTMSRTQ